MRHEKIVCDTGTTYENRPKKKFPAVETCIKKKLIFVMICDENQWFSEVEQTFLQQVLEMHL